MSNRGTKLYETKRRMEIDERIREYFRIKPGPLGSTDRKCPLDFEALYADLNMEQSRLSSLWAEKEITTWNKTLGMQCPKSTLF